jgi:hypothetical protein
MIDRFSGSYDWLSNFYEAQVMFDGMHYRTAEHAFQAQKTFDKKVKKCIRDLLQPSQAKSFGRTIRLRPDWEMVKRQIMFDVAWKKFSCNPTLLDKLLKTEGDELIEGNAHGDQYWGVDGYGIGENWLGKILMKVRSEIMLVKVGGKLIKRIVEFKLDGIVGPYETQGE